MSIDLSEFHDVFFEECFEGLDVMESGLLNLDHGTDVEEINSIFRAAHSIKGGGASFGFMEISNFTHVMETLLDEMRDGRRGVTRPAVDLLLESVDVLRGMVNAARDGGQSDAARVAEVQGKLEAMLAQKGGEEAAAPEAAAVADEPEVAEVQYGEPSETAIEQVCVGWNIRFAPHPDMLKSGNEPIRLFRELKEMGDLKVIADSSSVPSLEAVEPMSCYLRWELELRGDVSEDEILELFSWVENESDLELTPLMADAPQQAASVAAAPVQAAAPAEVAAKPAASAEKPAAAEPAKSGEPDAQPAAAQKAAAKESGGSIRVAIDKVDELINMVGELVITQSMLSQTGMLIEGGGEKMLEKLRDGISQLERNTRELQASVLQIRMLPVSFSFSRFPRLVRDLSSKMGKKIELKMTGEHTEVDKTVLEKIGDPLVHLVRNSLDHGIEMPDVRKKAGKPETGTLELKAYHEGGDIIIQVIDDGAGLNRDRILSKAIEKGLVGENEDLSDERVYNLIFAPGFSTADKISDVSGRGVGMDVVRRNVRDLGGNVSIANNLSGGGSTVTIRLPLTLAILDGQLVSISGETYIVSLVNIVESLQIRPERVKTVTEESELYLLREEYIPIVRVGQLFGSGDGDKALNRGLLMVVESDGKRYGLFVDDMLGQQQVVIKSLETNFRQIQGISGATILGDGTVALIIDVPGLIQRHFQYCDE